MMLHSHSLLFSDFDTDWYKKWSKELKQNKSNLEGHSIKANKFWQNATMVQALDERGLLKAGRSGIGFGVGQERLPALFAKHGVKVTATDQDFRTKNAELWKENELATNAASLNRLSICSPEKFRDNVSFRALDMTKIPSSLHGKYDFVWSNCALGHLGSIKTGLGFILSSAKYLKPGGYAVHTTEVNVLSDAQTVESGSTVIFRPRDLHLLAKMLQDAGYELDPLCLDFGKSEDDQKISMYPQFGNDYSKIQFGGQLLTQVILIIKRPLAKPRRARLLVNKRRAYRAYRRNVRQQKRFAMNSSFLRSIRRFERTSLNRGAIRPLHDILTVKLNKRKPKYVYLPYQNMTSHPLFGLYERLITTKPIVLATSNPKDRSSIFRADDWFNSQANRPSIYLFTKNKIGKWERADHVPAKSVFSFRVKLDGSRIIRGLYEERFTIVQEDHAHLLDTEVLVKILVN